MKASALLSKILRTCLSGQFRAWARQAALAEFLKRAWSKVTVVALFVQQELMVLTPGKRTAPRSPALVKQQLALEILVILSGQQADSPFPSDVAGIREMLPARTNVGLYSGPFYQRTLA